MREKFARFMQGRYGVDRLTKFLLYLGLVVLIISYFFRFTPTYYLSIIIIFFSYFRVFSRNYEARRHENDAYERFLYKLKGMFSGKTNGSYRDNSSRTAGVRIFECPSCSQKVRVPSGKGKIQITCPKCHVKFIKKT